MKKRYFKKTEVFDPKKQKEYEECLKLFYSGLKKDPKKEVASETFNITNDEILNITKGYEGVHGDKQNKKNWEEIKKQAYLNSYGSEFLNKKNKKR